MCSQASSLTSKHLVRRQTERPHTYATFDAAGYLEANADVAAAVVLQGRLNLLSIISLRLVKPEARSGSGVSADATVNPGTTFTLTTSAESLTGSANDDRLMGQSLTAIQRPLTHQPLLRPTF